MGKSFGLLMQTMPYVIMRAVAYLVFGLMTIVYWLVVVGLIAGIAGLLGEKAEGVAWVFVVIVLVGVGGFVGIVWLAERLVFYAIKAGHVAVITELLTKGSLPPGVNQVQYGRDAIQKHFGTMATFAAVDALVEGAVRQVLGWLTAAVNYLSFVPGLDTVWGLVRQVLSVAGNYIDEAVLSYILCHPNESAWKSGADGVVLYAQSWKKLLTGAVIVSLAIGAIWLIGFALFFPLGASLTSLAGKEFADMWWIGGIISGAIFGGILRAMFGDQMAMVMMVTAYHDAIAEQTPAVDMYEKLKGVSRKFNELANKAAQPVTA
jgi:hypothetical protein